MANILILGGGFGGVVAAESLARQIPKEHQITLVSRSSQFIFYPELVRLAFGKCEREDMSFDLREAMLDRRVRFVQAEVARIKLESRTVQVHGEIEGALAYDYLIVALGRRLATERVSGFYEHSHHLLTLESTLRFGAALRDFEEGRAVIGQCPGARLPVPVFETAFALAESLKSRGARDRTRITVVGPGSAEDQFGDADLAQAMVNALRQHNIEYVSDFPIERVTATAVLAKDGREINHDLLMLLPPFRGPGAVIGLGLTDDEGFLKVDRSLRVRDVENMYAVGDCVDLPGPKMGHMAVQQAEVAAANLALELEGVEPQPIYNHELMLIIDEGDRDAIYFHKSLGEDTKAVIRQGRFWNWVKRIHEKYWIAKHS